MKTEQCPICFTPLEVREVAPCMECGAIPHELEDSRQGKHTYAEYRLFGRFKLVLCNFCWIDFCSYKPEFFGLPATARIKLDKLEFLREIEPMPHTIDKVCLECGSRLPFLEFLVAVREWHQSRDASSG